MTDGQIVALYWDRDQRAVAESEKAYGAYCRTVAENILHDREDAEECVNDTWLRAWDSIPPQRPDSLKHFLAKVARNLAFDRWKAASAQKRGGGETALILDELAECVESGADVEKEYAAKELGAAVNRFVSGLPRREGDLFLRRYFYAEPVGEIARRYDMTENAVTTALSRTRKKLKTYLEQEGFLP